MVKIAIMPPICDYTEVVNDVNIKSANGLWQIATLMSLGLYVIKWFTLLNTNF